MLRVFRSLTLAASFLAFPTAARAQFVVFSTDFDTGVPAQLSGVTTPEPVQGYSGIGPTNNQPGGLFLRNTSFSSPTTLTLTESLFENPPGSPREGTRPTDSGLKSVAVGRLPSAGEGFRRASLGTGFVQPTPLRLHPAERVDELEVLQRAVAVVHDVLLRHAEDVEGTGRCAACRARFPRRIVQEMREGIGQTHIGG